MSKLFHNPNAQQTEESQSALMNNAAKDDFMCAVGDGPKTITLADLLSNDPGSAQFVSFGAGVTLIGEAYVLDAGLDGFDYTIRLANGTFSTAHVTVHDPLGESLFLEDFGSYTTADPWAAADLTGGGWTYESGSADTEVVKDGYQGIDGNLGGYWLDTQNSPGGIDISHAVNDANGGKAELVLVVATQEFDTWSTDGTLDVLWNGSVVLSIAPGDLDFANTFQDFTVVVDSYEGENSLEIADTAQATFVGFALDSVQVFDWLC